MLDSLTPFEAFELAVEKATSKSALARMVGCTPGNISQLVKKRSPLPTRFVLKAEAGTGISRHLLDPVAYPREDQLAPARADDLEPQR